MSYSECWMCDNPVIAWVFLIPVAVAAFFAARARNWTFVAALVGVPLAAWYLEGTVPALTTAGGILIGALAGLRAGTSRRASTSQRAA